MPKPSKYPKLRVSVKRGKAGQVWRSWWYDMRGTGKPDIPLGKDYDEAIRRWAEIHHEAPRISGTLEEAFRAWETADDGLLAERLAPETRRGYEKCLRMMRPAFESARWDEVTLPLLKAYVKARTAKSRARQEMQLLSVIWNWARLEGLTTIQWPAIGMQRSGWKGLSGVRNVEVAADAFQALHKHADQCLRDALDIASATGMRVHDVLALRLSDVKDGQIDLKAIKTGKTAQFDMLASVVLPPIMERRRAMRGVDHLFVLAAGRKPVTYRMLSARFDKARAAAAKECPEVATLWLRDMRKFASQLAGSLTEASKLLQHSSLSVTRRHYRGGDKLTPVR